MAEKTAPSAFLIDTMPVGLLSISDTGVIRFVNGTLAEMLGWAVRDLVGTHVDRVMTVGTKIFYQTHFFPVLRMHGRAEEIFMILCNAAGEEVGALVNAVRHERDGEWVIDCAVMRVRERRKFEDALLRAKVEADRARSAAEASAQDLLMANAQLEEQAVELELSQQQLGEQAAELEVQSEELRATNDTLMERTVELERLRVVADDANHAKSAFLAAMSHELRTPLNAIGGYVQLLQIGVHGTLTPPQLDTLDRVERSQRHLLRLINEVLNLARIEAGAVHYAVQPLVVLDIVNAVVPMVEPQLQQRGLSFDMDVPTGLVVAADRDKTEQVLLNLLGNAVKFTEANGHVRVHAHVTPDGRGVNIAVEDTGIGIPAERLDQIFEPFVQVDMSKSGRAEGTGLGLAISRDLARGMGGDLRATSAMGKGSCFTITLPMVAHQRP